MNASLEFRWMIALVTMMMKQAPQKSQRRLKSFGRSSYCTAHGMHVVACVGGSSLVLWTGNILVPVKLNLKLLPLNISSPSLLPKTNTISCLSFHSVNEKIPSSPLCILPPYYRAASNTSILAQNDDIYSLNNSKVTKEGDTSMKGHLHQVHARSQSPHANEDVRKFSASRLDLWRGWTEKIALLCPPPTASDARPFQRINWTENFFLYPQPRNSVYSILLALGDFLSETRFNVSLCRS